MARLDKNELKLIIKECLIEILAEGLAPPSPGKNTSREQNKSSRKQYMNEAFKQTKKQEKSLPRRKSHLDNMRMGNTPPPAAKKENIKRITSDPLMQDILSDTASTTLIEQGSANAKMPARPSAAGDRATQIANQNDPAELFAESAQNWAALAFS